MVETKSEEKRTAGKARRRENAKKKQEATKRKAEEEKKAKLLEAERKKAATNVDWNAVEKIVGKEAVDQMKQGERYTGDLYFQENNIDDECCRILALGLIKMTRVKKLHLHFNNIGDDGIADLCRALPEMKALKGLFLKDNNIGDDGCKSLLDLLKKGSLRRLEKLTCGGNSFSDEMKEEFETEWKTKGKQVGWGGLKI